VKARAYEFKRWDAINFVSNARGYKVYLELGVEQAITFKRVGCAEKFAVESGAHAVRGNVCYSMETDDFFGKHGSDRRYDIIFVDASDEFDQVLRDIYNSLLVLNDHGVILINGCMPDHVEGHRAMWRPFLHFCQLATVDCCLGDFDQGVGFILKRPTRTPLVLGRGAQDVPLITYNENMEKWLRVLPYCVDIVDWITLRDPETPEEDSEPASEEPEPTETGGN